MNEQTRDKGHTHMFRGTHGTNQNFIARPGNADIDSTGCQDEPLPQTLKPTRNFRPVEVHRQGTKPWRAQEVEGQCFRKHPESNHRGTGILVTKEARKIFARCLSSSFSVKGLPSNPRTRHPGVSSRSR